MMDHKTWLWKKRSTEQTTVTTDKVNLSSRGNEEETLLSEKAELQRELKTLNEKLSSALTESNTKDDIAKKQARRAQEAIAGWEKAEAEAISLKQELDKAIEQRVAGEERLINLDAALTECMQQLRFVREEQEKRIHDAVMKTSAEFEKTITALEEKFTESSKRLAKLGAENTQFSKALLAKGKVIEDLNEQRARVDADFRALMTRLESTEKENASLKYDVRVLEKELEIRNEEREFNRRTADVEHKQYLESVKKIAKLESECQRLRLLIRKRLPGPAALVKMKNEVEMLGRDPSETRRRKSYSSLTGSMDFAVDNSPDTPSKRINFLTEQLCAMEEENRTLKEILNKKTNELQLSRTMYAHTTSKLSQVEAQLEKSSKDQTAVGLARMPRNLLAPHELSLASFSDIGSDEKFNCAESWASASFSEMEHYRNGKQMGTTYCKTVGASEIDLMDDFVEMEKLAVYVDKPLGSSHFGSEEGNAISGRLEAHSGRYSSEATGREIIPVSNCQSDLLVADQAIQSKNVLIDKVPSWLDDILKVVLEQTRVTRRNPDDILEEIKVALPYVNHPNPTESGSSNRLIGNNISSAKKSNQQFHSDLGRSIHKIVELIQGINLPSPDYATTEVLSEKNDNIFSYKISETSTGYMVRVFQWKTSELSVVLQQFVQTCNNLLNGKADIEKFAEELTSALEWIMNHCFSLQDVSSMRDSIKKHFDWEESRSENEVESGTINHFSEADKLHVPKDQLSYLPIVSSWSGHNNLFQMEELCPNVSEESRRLKDELINMESAKKDLETRLHSEIGKSKTLRIQLQESEKTIQSLQTEVEIVRQSKGVIQDQIENHKMVKEDIDTPLMMAQVELNEARQKFSSLEKELENKNNCCEELEATCLDLQLQLESVTKKEIPKNDRQEEKQLRTDWEITTASEKLAECQETILNLGKQFKALASPREAALFDMVTSTPTDTSNTTTIVPKKNNSQRSSLLDKMLAEDNAETGDHRSPMTKEIICTSKSVSLLDDNSCSAFGLNGALDSPERFHRLNGVKHQDEEAIVNSMAIVPSKKKGGGLLKKLLWRRKRTNSKKTPTPFPYAA